MKVQGRLECHCECAKSDAILPTSVSSLASRVCNHIVVNVNIVLRPLALGRRHVISTTASQATGGVGGRRCNCFRVRHATHAFRHVYQLAGLEFRAY